MKKILHSGITVVALLIVSLSVKAQDYAATEVKLTLSDFITAYTTATVVHSNIGATVIDGALPTGVTFTYSTATDYAADKNHTVAGHLKVSSSKALRFRKKP